MCNLLYLLIPQQTARAGDNLQSEPSSVYGLIRVIHDLLICCALRGSINATCLPIDYGPNNHNVDGLLINAFGSSFR